MSRVSSQNKYFTLLKSELKSNYSNRTHNNNLSLLQLVQLAVRLQLLAAPAASQKYWRKALQWSSRNRKKSGFRWSFAMIRSITFEMSIYIYIYIYISDAIWCAWGGIYTAMDCTPIQWAARTDLVWPAVQEEVLDFFCFINRDFLAANGRMQ